MASSTYELHVLNAEIQGTASVKLRYNFVLTFFVAAINAAVCCFLAPAASSRRITLIFFLDALLVTGVFFDFGRCSKQKRGRIWR